MGCFEDLMEFREAVDGLSEKDGPPKKRQEDSGNPPDLAKGSQRING